MFDWRDKKLEFEDRRLPVVQIQPSEGRQDNQNQSSKYTVSESPEFQLGSVTNLWAVATQSDESGKPLKELAKIRIANRELPGSETFDEYIAMRSSCWILEERDGDFFCDCPICMKVVFYTCIFCVYKLIS